VPDGLNLHIIRVSGDEASLVLGLGQILAWASNRLYGMVLRGFKFSIFVSPFRRPWFSLGTIITFAALAAILYASYPEDVLTFMGNTYKLFWPLRLTSLAFGFFLIGSISRVYDRFLLGLTLIGVLISSLLVCKVVGTKDQDSLLSGMLKAFCIDVDTEASPAGFWRIAQFSKNDRPEPAQSELVHSIYVEERVHDEVISWIRWSEECRRTTSDGIP
jgi:hypothetical protein